MPRISILADVDVLAADEPEGQIAADLSARSLDHVAAPARFWRCLGASQEGAVNYAAFKQRQYGCLADHLGQRVKREGPRASRPDGRMAARQRTAKRARARKRRFRAGGRPRPA